MVFRVWIPSSTMNPNARPDLDRCRAAVPLGGRLVGSCQCTRKPTTFDADGIGWCTQHAPMQETGEMVYGIALNYRTDRPVLVANRVLKRTKRRLVLKERLSPWDHKEHVDPDDVHLISKDSDQVQPLVEAMVAELLGNPAAG